MFLFEIALWSILAATFGHLRLTVDYIHTYIRSGPCTAPFSDSLYIRLQQSYTSNEVQDSAYRGVMILVWFHKRVAQ
jgi:hypothetical protein